MEQKLYDLLDSIYNLEGVAIPFNIIRQYIMPLRKWLEEQIPEHEKPELIKP